MRQALALLLVLVAPVAVRADSADEFDRTVAPLLARACLDCHGGAEPKGGLDLSTRRGALAGGESGAAVVAGNPDESLLWQRVGGDEMPPESPLTDSEKDVLRGWIAKGAAWGTDPIDPFRVTTEKRAGYDWWSLQPVARPTAPAVAGADWARNDVDRFVLAELESRGLAPTREADRRTLIRRLSLDLLGLPPSYEEVEAFVGDHSPDAYERLVERLLASPHYGERWARHWLDVAHFGESDGFEFDRLRPSAWPYRDWVVAALNADMPYDEFARMQIAGDVLRTEDARAATATGFLVGGMHDSLVPAGEAMRMVMRQDELEDLTALVGQTFLGLTLQCARCHDHKFDPLRQTDYFRVAAALAGVHRGEKVIAPRGEVERARQRIAALRERRQAIDDVARQSVLARRAAGELPAAALPRPIAAWEFDDDLRDSVGGLDGAAYGGARLDEGGLVLDGKEAYVATEPIDRELKAKTLTATVKLADLAQRGGGVIGVQTPGGDAFDALVFGEREPRRWMAGSEFYRRTRPFRGEDEAAGSDKPVHVAIVYAEDGTIAAYRDGRPYGKSYTVDVRTFAAGTAQVVFGVRHGRPGPGKMLAGVIERAALYDRALTAEEVLAASGADPEFVGEAELLAALAPEQRVRRDELSREIDGAEAELQRLQGMKVFAVTPKEAPVTRVLARGNPLQPGEPIAAAGIASVVGLPAEFGLAVDAGDAERRAALAGWIADRRNPLFARTVVNRLWHYHFGAGLVETPSDLGFNGRRPSHPELLDWLASELIESGWSLKHVQRLIVGSETYRQGSSAELGARSAERSSVPRSEFRAPSSIDAANRLLWRKSPQRTEAEVMRDAILMVSGQLNRRMAGPGYQDFRPFVRGNTQFYEATDPAGPEFHRRSLYRTWARGGHNPLLDVFDCPDPSTMTPRRAATNTPLQALSLMNNSFVLRMSEHFAERVRGEAGDDVGRQADEAYRAVYGREPSGDERALAREFIGRHGLGAFGRVLFNTNEFLYVR